MAECTSWEGFIGVEVECVLNKSNVIGLKQWQTVVKQVGLDRGETVVWLEHDDKTFFLRHSTSKLRDIVVPEEEQVLQRKEFFKKCRYFRVLKSTVLNTLLLNLVMLIFCLFRHFTSVISLDNYITRILHQNKVGIHLMFSLIFLDSFYCYINLYFHSSR